MSKEVVQQVELSPGKKAVLSFIVEHLAGKPSLEHNVQLVVQALLAIQASDRATNEVTAEATDSELTNYLAAKTDPHQGPLDIMSDLAKSQYDAMLFGTAMTAEGFKRTMAINFVYQILRLAKYIQSQPNNLERRLYAHS